MGLSYNIKKFVLKNSIVKIGLVLALLVSDGYLCFSVFKSYTTGLELTREIADYKEKTQDSIYGDSEVRGLDVYNLVSSMKSIKSIKSIVQLDTDPGMEVMGNLKLDTLKGLSKDCIVEFTFESSDINESLKSLNSGQLVYEYVSVDFNTITFRVFAKGGA